jgi:hypothetical protein
MVTIRILVLPAVSASFSIIAMQVVLKKKEESLRKRRWWYRKLFHQWLQCDNRFVKDMQGKLVDNIIKIFTRMTLEIQKLQEWIPTREMQVL